MPRAIAWIGLMFFGICHAAALQPLTLVPPNPPAKFARAFFGMHVHNNNAQRSWPNVTIGSIRLWDARVGWAYLEPQKGAWQFARLDEYVDWAQGHGVDILLPFGITPRWASARPNEKGAYGPGSAAEASNLEDWRSYVRTVVQRYRGRVATYEVLNEANIPNFYSGDLQTLVSLTRIASQEIRKFDHSARVVAPSGVGLDSRVAWPAQLLAAGASADVDIASFHLYHGANPPESMIQPVLKMRRSLDSAGFGSIPLWNTETGYWMADGGMQWSPDELRNLVTEASAAEYLPRDMLLSRALGFERYYWYAWDNTKMGFLDPRSGKNRPAAAVFAQAFTNLLRSTLNSCERDVAGLWSCWLTGANGLRMAAIWTDPGAQERRQVFTPAWRAKFMVLDGSMPWQAADTAVQVGPIVTLLAEVP